jgi:hypothetical protein
MEQDLILMLKDELLSIFPEYEGAIEIFLLNMILVITGGRLSYLIDLNYEFYGDLQDTAINYILSIWGNKITVNKGKERLVYLTKNKNKIMTYSNYGEVLGYCYTKGDHANLNLDRFFIMPTALKDDKEYFLFTTFIPKKSFNREMKTCVIDQVNLFDDILKDFGYRVILTIWNYPAHLHPTPINIADELLEDYYLG